MLRRLAVAVPALVLLCPVAARAANCAGTSVGLTPLDQLGAGTYQGQPGGFYPGGANARPAAHDADLVRLGLPVPLDAAGSPDPVNGKIGLISIGMSNCTQEWSVFMPLAEADPQRNPRLVIVDCAFPGKTAAIIQNPADAYWAWCDGQLATAGLSNAQVQAVWLKEADANPSSGWPAYARTLADEEGVVLQNIKARYPGTRVAYISSRTYGGYASTALNPEPYAYESGFSVKWLVEAQLAGDPRYNFDPARGAVLAPWIAWGPYLWADGLTPRRDGFTWECADFANDGTHPAASGRDKVARLLLDFFRSDPTTVPWFLACAGLPPGEVTALKRGKQAEQAELHWTSQDPGAGAATVYDVLSGPIATLHADGGFGGGACLAPDIADSPWPAGGGPVLRFKLDEGAGPTAADSTGNGHTGQVTGATWVAGRFGGGLQFDGVSSVVTVPSTPLLSPPDQLTVAVWARPDTLTNGVLAAKWDSGVDQTWMMRVRPDGMVLVNIVPTLTDGTYNNAGGTAAGLVVPGAWQHVAFVYDGRQATDAGRLKSYLDGVAQPLTFASGGIPATLTRGATPVSLGLGAEGLRPYAGALDEPRVYGRALSAAEIAALAAPATSIWYKVRARNGCGVGSWGDVALDGGAVRCP